MEITAIVIQTNKEIGPTNVTNQIKKINNKLFFEDRKTIIKESKLTTFSSIIKNM